MTKRSDKFTTDIQDYSDMKKFLLNKLNSLENKDNTSDDPFHEKDVDVMLMTIPDNTPDNRPYSTPPESTIYIKNSNVKINKTVRKCISEINNLVAPSKVYNTVKEKLNDIAKTESTELVAKHEILYAEMSLATANSFTALFVFLREDTRGYKRLVKFILSTLLRRAHTPQELEGKNMNILLGDMQEDWILLGSFAHDYLKKKQLPDAGFLTELSSAHYEGSDSEARIYFSNRSLKTVIRFNPSIGAKTRILFNKNLRPIRKLMELSSRRVLHLYAEKTDESDTNYYTITELVQLRDDYSDGSAEGNSNRKIPNDIYIKFSGFMHWSLVCGTKEIFSYYHGNYQLNPTAMNNNHKAVIDKLHTVSEDVKRDIMDLIEILKEQKHGTSVVLSDFSCKKGKKLIDDLCQKNYGIRFDSVFSDNSHPSWNKGLLLSLTDIDGAIFIDINQKNIAAIGVLLYSDINVDGNVGRGSRYNSMHNYIMEKKNGVYIGIVISEDHMIDIFQNKEKADT